MFCAVSALDGYYTQEHTNLPNDLRIFFEIVKTCWKIISLTGIRSAFTVQHRHPLYRTKLLQRLFLSVFYRFEVYGFFYI